MTSTPDSRKRRRLSNARRRPTKKPAIAEKAHDLEAIKKALEDATSVGAGFWLSYLFLTFYIAIAAGAVTHVDLLVENPVKLPFLNVELPLKAFFFLAPILFLIAHMFTLSKLVILADKARRFHEELIAQIPDAADRDGLRRQLPSNIFVQGLAGPRSTRESAFGWLLRAMGWMSMAVAPILLLLLLQLQFLPYHETWLTWEHRLALLADVALLWWLWRKVLAGDGGAARSKWVSALLHASGGGASLAALGFAWIVATFPGEWRAAPWPAATQLAFDSLSWPKNALFLPELNIWEAYKLDDPKKLDWKDNTIVLKGRHLEGANFSNANLGKANLEGAQLQGADLFLIRLQGARLFTANLKGAMLSAAFLQGASLDSAQLQGAELFYAQLRGASLEGAQLQGTKLDEAHFDGASLHKAQLQSASLVRAVLRATDLSEAFLWRSVWSNAQATLTLISLLNWRPEVLNYAVFENTAVPWTQDRYEALRKLLSHVVQEGPLRADAMHRIEGLQCAKGVCDSNADSNTQREQIERSGVDEARYRAALSGVLNQLICSGDASAIHILHGVIYNRRILETGPYASVLVDVIMSAKCVLSSALTVDDKATLRSIKRAAERNYPPALAPAQKPK